MMMMMMICLQSHRIRDVFPVLPALHLPPPGHSDRLLGRHCCVSFPTQTSPTESSPVAGDQLDGRAVDV